MLGLRACPKLACRPAIGAIITGFRPPEFARPWPSWKACIELMSELTSLAEDPGGTPIMGGPDKIGEGGIMPAPLYMPFPMPFPD